MKKRLNFIFCFLIFTILCFSMCSCLTQNNTDTSSGNEKNHINNTNSSVDTKNDASADNTDGHVCNFKTPEMRLQYQKSYVRKDGTSKEGFVFYENGSGKFHVYEKENGVVSSGYICFDWRTATDGAVHLFADDEVHTAENNTNENLKISLPTRMLFISEDFVTFYTEESGYVDSIGGYSNTVKCDYILTGSSLDKD